MVIGKYIKQLLEEHKRVILPGFGNLDVKDSSGGVPVSGIRIDPPGLSVRFDAGFSKDDGLLASVYSKGEGIEEEEARQQVLELVDAIRFALDKGESYAVPGTGTFTRDDDGKVYFRVDPDWVVEPDQYGLESMDLLELEEVQEEEEVVQAPEKEPEQPVPSTPEPVSATVQEPAPKEAPRPITKLAEPQSRKRKAQPVRRWRVIWIVAASLIVVLMALIFIPVDNIREKGRNTPATNLPQDREVPVLKQGPAAEGANDEQPAGQEPSIQREAPTEVAATEELADETPGHNFFIIAGSFQHVKNASDLQDQLRARGYPSEVMITENRMYRVSVASYATKEEAERALARVKSTSGLESCWLLSN